MRGKKLALIAFCLFTSLPAFPQLMTESADIPTTPSEPAYGTSADSVIAIAGASFIPILGGTRSFNNYYYWSSSVHPSLSASVSLPSGALVTAIEVDGCDESNTHQLVAALVRSGSGALNSVTTGNAATPGCATFSVALNHSVSNAGSAYAIEVLNGNYTGDVRIATARVRYRRQVSSGPGTATFTDVPTNHGFFKFVEALAAAGITGGCGGGNFCPDAALTRGQMAVFLASALGLHFPN